MNIAAIIRAEKLCFVGNYWYKLCGNKKMYCHVLIFVPLNYYFID